MFSVDMDSSKVFARVFNNEIEENYECSLLACKDPVCTCSIVTLELTPTASAEDGHVDAVAHQVEINLAKKSLAFKDMKKAPPEDLVFSELFLTQLDDDDYNLLFNWNFSIKNMFTEEAPSDSIMVKFDYDDVENSGLMHVYNSILPYGDPILSTVGDLECVVYDQYCIKTNCSCRDATLTFLDRNSFQEQDSSLFAVSVDYKKKKWKAVEMDPTSPHLDLVQSSLLNEYPDFYELLKTRHERLKSIYEHCKKRDYSPKQKPGSQKIGRNDPCPCGSGKKYKKCCLGK